MERKGFSKSDKSVSEGAMSTQALSDAKTWLDVMHDAEYRGRKDTDGAARFRLANKLGVKENYLFRLQYRAAEMKDVAGEVDRSEGSRWCQWEKVEDGWIEIVLPKWADETSQKARQQPAAQKPAEKYTPPVAQTARASSTVTAAVMGDPPPGRREMLKKMGEMKV